MNAQQWDEAKLLERALDDIAHNRCANCRNTAPRETSLCNECWTKATNQQIRWLALAQIPEPKGN